MGDDDKSSFHGGLSRFAYAPQSSLVSSSLLSRHDQRAQTLCSIKEDRSSTSTAPLVTTLSCKREGDSVRRSRKRRTTKLGNDPAAHLSGIPDCVAEDLDGLSRFYYQPYLTLFC
jgi:hypothetical protein